MKYEAVGIAAGEAEASVLALWKTLPSPPAEAMFRWSYLDNPSGPARCFLLRQSTVPPEIVGMTGINERAFDCDDLSLSSALLGGFFVDKAHRTFFPALTLQRAVHAWSRQNFDFIYGFPNEAAAPIMKRLGFRDLVPLGRYVLVLRHARYVEPFVGSKIMARALAAPVDGWRQVAQPGISRAAPRGLELRRYDGVDERFDALYRNRAFRASPMGRRSAAFLRWRFLQRPDQRAEVYGLASRRTDELHAYAIVHVEGDVAHVRDLLGVDVDSVTTTLRLVAGAMRRRGCHALSFLCAGPSELLDRLPALGFRARPTARKLVGCAGDRLAGDPSRARLLDEVHRWYVTEADEDQ